MNSVNNGGTNRFIKPHKINQYVSVVMNSVQYLIGDVKHVKAGIGVATVTNRKFLKDKKIIAIISRNTTFIWSYEQNQQNIIITSNAMSKNIIIYGLEIIEIGNHFWQFYVKQTGYHACW